DNWKFGFISYDYKNKIENLSSDHFDGIGFPEHFFFTPDLLFQINENTLKISYNTDIYHEREIIDMMRKVEKMELPAIEAEPVKITPRLSREAYIDNVKKIKEHIQQGDIYEVNFCQEFYAEQVEIHPVQLYFKLNERSPT